MIVSDSKAQNALPGHYIFVSANTEKALRSDKT